MTWAKFGEMAVQELGKTVAQKVAQNPQVSLATGVAIAKTVGGAMVVAAPYVLAVGGGLALTYGAVKVMEKAFGK